MVRRTALDVIDIPRPCSQPWDTMKGDERRRFCEACGLHVHNLSAMTAQEPTSEPNGPAMDRKWP